MTRRPMPQFPRGPRKRAAARTLPVLLGCPRLSPEWELAALRALVKPQTRNRLVHRTGDQAWPASARTVLEQSVNDVERLLGVRFEFHFPDAGDFFAVAPIPTERRGDALALVWLVSRRLPALWFVFDRLRVKEGVFYRRRQRFKLELTVATNVHLPRGTRAVLVQLLKKS